MLLLRQTLQLLSLTLNHRLVCSILVIMYLLLLYRYKCQYSPKDKSYETINVTLDIESWPQKYDKKNKVVIKDEYGGKDVL
jgi:hypothetical protein